MKYISLFDITGPIMIGPSSSHTAGAVRIGLLARKIYGDKPTAVRFTLYNSYAKTGKGHGTDKGLLAGILGFDVSDPRIKDAISIAQKENVSFQFVFANDAGRYPNSVDIHILCDNPMKIVADSIGAGEILVKEINGFKTELNGDYPSLFLVYRDKLGVISKVTEIIQRYDINIASLHCDRTSKGKIASMSVALDSKLSKEAMAELSLLEDVYLLRNIERLDK